MILSSHIVTASVLTAPFWQGPLNFFTGAAVFLISLVSHYLLDFIPHWEYELKSIVKVIDKDGVYRGQKKFIPEFFYQDLWKIFLDAALGLALLVLINGLPKTGAEFFLAGLSVFSSTLPDSLEYLRAKWEIFSNFFALEKKIHLKSHSSYRSFFKTHYILGIIFQILIIAAVILTEAAVKPST